MYSFNTASGRYCCNYVKDAMKYLASKGVVVSIPQAVGTVATVVTLADVIKHSIVSIPQAVGTVATFVDGVSEDESLYVSIPQAVGTVATFYLFF